jgi:hypothetical protein
MCALAYNIDTLGKRLHLAGVSSLFLFLEEKYETHTSQERCSSSCINCCFGCLLKLRFINIFI